MKKKSILFALAMALGATGASAQMQGRPNSSSPPEQNPNNMGQSGMGAMGQGSMGNDGMSRGLPDQNAHGNNGGSSMGGSSMGGSTGMRGSAGSSMGGMSSNMSASTSGDMMPPRHWTKGGTAWTDHSKRCSTRYRSYNPRTDMYVASKGMKRRCML